MSLSASSLMKWNWRKVYWFRRSAWTAARQGPPLLPCFCSLLPLRWRKKLVSYWLAKQTTNYEQLEGNQERNIARVKTSQRMKPSCHFRCFQQSTELLAGRIVLSKVRFWRPEMENGKDREEKERDKAVEIFLLRALWFSEKAMEESGEIKENKLGFNLK